jgi:SAM-dependent methyltransferase
MPWWFAIAERDHHLQNPTSEEKIRLLGERLRLDSRSRVLDVASGKAGPALVLASTFGCRIVAVEKASEFAAVARERVADAGLADLIELHQADVREFPLEREGFDAALCLGASFVWEGLEGTLSALEPAVGLGGYVVVGEPYWRRWPLPPGIEQEGFVSLAETAGRFAAAGLGVEAVIASSADDWDRYESLHWRAVEEWLDENPAHPDAEEFRRRNDEYRDRYLRVLRELLGWAILAGRKRTGVVGSSREC